jgi:hypothetical protein
MADGRWALRVHLSARGHQDPRSGRPTTRGLGTTQFRLRPAEAVEPLQLVSHLDREPVRATVQDPIGDLKSHVIGITLLGTHDEVRRSAGRDQLVVRMGLGIGSAVCQPTLGF